MGKEKHPKPKRSLGDDPVVRGPSRTREDERQAVWAARARDLPLIRKDNDFEGDAEWDEADD